MDFGFSEEQEMLRQSVREFLEAECPMTYVRQMMEDERGFSEDQWRKMAELGWTGLIVPERFGGAGLNMVDMVVVLEEMGKVVFPGPFFASAILGGIAIDLGGSEAQKQRWLPALADGSQRATLAQVEESGRWDADGIQLPAKAAGSGFAVSGTKLFVHDAHNADLLIVPVRTGGSGTDGITMLVVERKAKGVAVRVLKTMDQTRKLCEVTFDNVAVGKDAVLGEVGKGWGLLDRLVDRAKVALCAEMCGGAQKVLEMSVEYAKVREQFGKPIGSFQAIQHKCANMMVQVESAKSATYYAAWAVANDVAEAHLAACMAKAYTSDAYRFVSAEGIQIHGGIGFTWEHDMHLYFKRAKGSEVTFGDATHNRELVAQVVLDAPESAASPA
ncbi:MAG TPA: acyl-CoA dehydrogenase family protein [Candidatus Dormibacteraeota bacterium]|nr:acyl-CoA dehydrogenase family protein [Candidatus Dormibacteraeota bacterium]